MTIKAAQDLVRRRWDNATDEDRAEAARKMHAGRQKKLTGKERSEIARNAAKKRWGKVGKKAKKKAKE